GNQECAGQRNGLPVELTRSWNPVAGSVLLFEFELGRLTNQLLGFLGVLEAWQLDDDAVSAEHLDLRLGDAVRVDAPRDDVEDTLHGRALLVGGYLAQISLKCQLCAALQVEAELGALAYEVTDVDA